MFDNEKNGDVTQESKNYIKYIGVLAHKNLTWKYHIDAITAKISKTIGLISKLRHSIPRHILFYYMEESVLLGTKPLVDSIRHFIRDASGVFSVCHLCECRIVQ